MTDVLHDRLRIPSQAKSDFGKFFGRLKSIATFFSDAIEGMKNGKTAIEAITKCVPWSEEVGTAVRETVPVLKFAATLFENLAKEHDPETLGFLASTLAYQRSVEEAMNWICVPDGAKNAADEMNQQLAELEPTDAVDFKKFTFRTALEHEFVTKADKAFLRYLNSAGYSEVQTRELINRVHRCFIGNLKTILSDGKLKERFEPFTRRMQLGTAEELSYDAILSHIYHQRWLFEEAPLFRSEPYALADVYIDSECGNLTWRQVQIGADASENGPIRRQDLIDPFSEQYGGRHDLLETVLTLMGDSSFTEAIVIQGVAGSGKSSFTLRLCVALEKEGLFPIRVRLRDLPLDRHIADALSKAMFLPDRDLTPTSRGRSCDDPFLGGAIFSEATSFRGIMICPYVLILDGWDEISISAAEGFKVRMARMLEQLRAEFLRRRGAPVRVILTGRPSTAVSESLFLKEETRLLTIRLIKPDQLRKFVRDLDLALKVRGADVTGSQVDKWTLPPLYVFEPVFQRYNSEFFTILDRQLKQTKAGSLAVLGLPLLAHLAVRLIAQWEGDRAALVSNPTTLYRNLVDLTCEKGGNIEQISIDSFWRIAGSKLRKLLQGTAAAMTANGGENISYRELSLRLGLKDEQLDIQVSQLVERYDLAPFMISFFFKGGLTHLGCEFVHKSFREYLFAEAIVETLKDFGRDDTAVLRERISYWKDFSDDDPQRAFTRKLSKLLSPQWLSTEVIAHIEELLSWEIGSAVSGDSPIPKRAGGAPVPISIEQWMHVRDGLADVWHWWGEGVHMRPQLIEERMTRAVTFQPAYAHELVEAAAPWDRNGKNMKISPSRVTTMDAHLGDGLFRLCAIVHYQIAIRTGWLVARRQDRQEPKRDELWSEVSEVGKGPRKCQSKVVHSQGSWVLFAPSADDATYFANYISRINSAGWRPSGSFPYGIDASGIDLRLATVATTPRGGNFHTIWRHANLSDTSNELGLLCGHDFTAMRAHGISLSSAFLRGSIFRDADLSGANLNGAFLGNANLSGAYLEEADLRFANLSKANLSGAYLGGARLSDANLSHANLSHANLRYANLRDANLSHANLVGANLNGVFLGNANLSGAELTTANLNIANLNGANLAGANLAGANLRGANVRGTILDDTVLDSANPSESESRSE
jgi:uncharacterized protein YjbI with pentapeptide repeats